MGLTASVGKDNDELVDNLVSSDSVKTERIEQIMRLVDRGKFVLGSERENAYKDSAWKEEANNRDPGIGALHLSAPCIYASVLENLDLAAEMSFLNIGSGTGYLSSMVGFIIGEKGISHGVELYQNIVDFANERISEIQQSEEASAYEWCTPTYNVGNAFQIEANMRYDRIYCGALVPESRRSYFCSFLNVGGLLIMPYGHALQRIVRKSESEFVTRDISAVTFSHLIPINPEAPFTNQPTKLPVLEPLSLCDICRNVIRRCVRQKVEQTRKIEVRFICHKKSAEEEPNPPARDEDESSQGSEQRTQHEDALQRRRHHFRRFPFIFIEREDRNRDGNEAEGEEAEHHPLNIHQIHPMRHLLALMARERLNRHHAARARQAAGLVDGHENEEEQQQQPPPQRQERRRWRFNIAANRSAEAAGPIAGEGDVDFGFHFISENQNDEDDIEPQMHNLFDEVRAEEEAGHDEQMEEFRRHVIDLTSDDEEEDENIDRGDDGGIDREDDDTGGAFEADNSSDQPLESSHDELKDVQDQEDYQSAHDDEEFIPLKASSPVNEVVPSTSKVNLLKNNEKQFDESGSSRASLQGGGKRQRTFTSESLEQMRERKIKRILSREPTLPDKPSSSTRSSNDVHVEAKFEFGKKEENDEGKSEDQPIAVKVKKRSKSETDAISTNGSNYTDADDESFINKDEEKPAVTAEQQAQQLREFHTEFTTLLETLPLNIQMRRFLTYKLN